MTDHIRGHGRVFLRGTTWWLAYFQHGREIRESTGLRVDPRRPDRGQRKAEQRLDQRRGQLAAGTFIDPKHDRLSFEDLVTPYLQDYTVRGFRRATAGYRVQHLRTFFATDRVRDITAVRLRTYQAHRLSERAQPATINRELAALHRMVVLAVKQQRLSVALCPVFPDRLEEAPPRQGFFEPEDYEAIRAHLPTDYQDVLDFGYYTGWRRREVTGLTWPEVDLAGGVIRLHPGRSKTKTPRLLPLALPLRDVIERRLAVRQPELPLVFHTHGRPIGDWRKTWHRACAKAGLSKRFHDLRRTAARNYVRSGTPERVAMQLLGHKTRSVFDRYNIVSEADLTQAVGRLAYHVRAVHTAATPAKEISR